MKVTVTFGDTAVVVPCKAGWTVKDLVDQATRRYRRIAEQQGDSVVSTHHLEYSDGGILDMDDPLADLVEDREKLVAVFELERDRVESPRESVSNGYSSSSPVPEPEPEPEPEAYYPHLEYHDPGRGEIEVNEATLRGNTPLLVRSSSDSVLAPPTIIRATPPPDDRSVGTPEPEVNNVLKGALERLRVEEQESRMSPVNKKPLTKTVEFSGNRGPLGIHVVPYCSSLSGRTLGLHIRGIDEKSRSKKENLFQEDECIVQINDTSLLDKTFAQSQEVFRQAMSAPSVRLEVLPAANKPRYEKSLIGHIFNSDSRDSSAKASPLVVRSRAASQPLDPNPRPKIDLRPPENRSPEPPVSVAQPAEAQPVEAQPTEAQPTEAQLTEAQPGYGSERQTPTPPAGGTAPSPTPKAQSKGPVAPMLANLTNKKGGKKMKIDLKKGPEGLGFTVVTSSVQGPGPILVKNILQRGAAVKDGRLQPGDRILEVNGVDMTDRSQEELVAMLRSTKQGEAVSLVVARQEDVFLPRELKGEDASSLVTEDGREQLMFEVPLNESGSAGLGVSLKGNKSRETGEDLGIFIKSIIHGGAAYKDGRLAVNDQLIAVNGEGLVGRSNHAAMETLRRSMSSEGNARGTIQLVVLRAARQITGAVNPPSSPAPPAASANQTSPPQHFSTNQNSLDYDVPPRPTRLDPNSSAMPNSFPAPFAAASTNGSGYSNYGNSHPGDPDDSFPPPPSPGAVEEMNRDLPLTPPHYSEFPKPPFYNEGNLKDNHRASKSMDLVADEGNIRSLSGPPKDRPEGGALGPTLGLMKSSSLESLQTAMEEVRHSSALNPVPFHRPRPNMVRGRGCNMSFRHAIDKSYEGPSEDDDDMSDRSSGHETPASTSSRNDLDADDNSKKKKKKTKGKKKEKKSKPKKETVDDPDKKKKKGFGLLRFGKKKDDKTKGSKTKLDALSEEELERVPDHRDGPDPRYAEIHSGRFTPDLDDDDFDPRYAQLNDFRRIPEPQPYRTRTPSPPAGARAQKHPPHHLSAEDLDGLYAKVNKPRKTANDPNQAESGLRREYQARAIPAYDELDSARRRVLDYDPNRLAPRSNEIRPSHHYEEIDRQLIGQPRRDPYDYPRPVSNDYYDDPNARHYPTSSRTADADQRGRPQYYEPARREAQRQASPGRYVDERYADERYADERYAYGDGRDPRRKNPVIGAV